MFLWEFSNHIGSYLPCCVFTDTDIYYIFSFTLLLITRNLLVSKKTARLFRDVYLLNFTVRNIFNCFIQYFFETATAKIKLHDRVWEPTALLVCVMLTLSGLDKKNRCCILLQAECLLNKWSRNRRLYCALQLFN